MNRPLSLTRDGLLHALASIATELRRPPDAIDRAIVKLDAQMTARKADIAAADLAEATIARMVRCPQYITRSVYGVSHPMVWPPRAGMTAEDVLAECRARIANELGRAGHWTYEPSRLVALRQAEKALERLVASAVNAGRT